MTDSPRAPLLIEIGCEDLPARFVVPLADALRDGIAGGLVKRGVAAGGTTSFATPRRIAVLVDAVAARQPDQTIEKSGPAVAAALKDGQPTPAALGFAKTCGVSFAELGEKNGKLHYARQQPGRATLELLPEIFEDTIKAMDELVPKRMRWGSGDETFVRPVQWLTALLGNDIVSLRRFGLEAGRVTYGHRAHAADAITLATPNDYAAKLQGAHVWADVASRRAEIRRQIEAEGLRLGGTPKISEDLLDEVTALVEWPVVISGRIEARFLELPPEVIVATVETNQRYFTVFDAAAKLLPAFITISNIESKDVAQVIQGNERVVRPRLSDALFFWQQDLKQPLAAFGEKLETVTFQKDLGSTAAKVARVTALAKSVAEQLGAAVPVATRAAQLAKCDLATKMVYEFPELQGLMGGYYAAKSGEPAAVATAIREHYLPTQHGTPIPSTVEGQIVALADKLDTLAGIFAIGQKPTASKDPFALRRAALGVLRILIEGALPLDVRELLKRALDAQPAGKRDEATLKELASFVMERLRAYRVGTEIDDRPVRVEEFESVASLEISCPLDFEARLRALHWFWALDAAKSLAGAHKRVRNILKQADQVPSADHWDYLKLRGTDADRALLSATEATLDGRATRSNAGLSVNPSASGSPLLLLEKGYRRELEALAKLSVPVSKFFEQEAMVMDPDLNLRSGRITVLRNLDDLCRSVADISLLPG